MALELIICILLPIYVCAYVCISLYFIIMFFIAQNIVKCAVFIGFCQENGKSYGKMKKNWENVWWYQIFFVPLHRQ